MCVCVWEGRRGWGRSGREEGRGDGGGEREGSGGGKEVKSDFKARRGFV